MCLFTKLSWLNNSFRCCKAANKLNVGWFGRSFLFYKFSLGFTHNQSFTKLHSRLDEVGFDPNTSPQYFRLEL